MSKCIQLTGKHAVGGTQFAIVDDEQYEHLSQWKWKATPLSTGGHRYAVRNTTVNGKNTTVYLHRYVIGYVGLDDVDHINHNSLDNRRENLRVVSRSTNILNRRRVSVRGVCAACGKEYVLDNQPAGSAPHRRYCSLECRPSHQKQEEIEARKLWLHSHGRA